MTLTGIQAFVETLVVFTLWYAIGLACTSPARRALPSQVRACVSPVIGSAVCTVGTLALSRLGLPVNAFALPLVITLFVLSLTVLLVRRDRINGRLIAGIALPLACVLALFAWPIFQYGFDWASFTNADMTNYAMVAQRLQSTGYFTPPALAGIADGANTRGAWWTFTALIGERTGVDANLAFTASLFRQNPIRVFMVFSLAGYLATALAAGALVDLSSKSQWKRVAVILFVGFAPLSAYGFAYQLLAQTFGLATLAAFAALWLRTFSTPSAREQMALGLCRALVLAGLVAVYPELVPLGAVAFVLRCVIKYRQLAIKTELSIDLGASLVAFGLLGSYAIAMVDLVHGRSASLGRGAQELNSTFPYYLLPSGFSTLWGLEHIAHWYADPLESIIIASGMLLTTICISAATYFTYKRDIPAAPLVVAFALLAADAAYQRAGFALYKLAMYVRPFAIPVFIELADRAVRRGQRAFGRRYEPYSRIALGAMALAVASCWAPITWSHVVASVNERYDESVAVPNATPHRLYDELSKLERTTGPNRLISDTSNESLAKVEANLMPSHRWLFTGDFFALSRSMILGKGPGEERFQRQLLALHDRVWHDETIDFCPNCPDPQNAVFSEDVRWTQEPSKTSIVLSTGRQSIFNREMTKNLPGDVAIVPYEDATNALLLIDSTIGGMRSNITPIDRVSLYALQPDYFDPSRTMAGIGRHLLFMLPHPTRYFRVIIDFTTTLQADGENIIPSPSIRANGLMTVQAVGRGSARLISDPLAADTLGRLALIGINMNSDGTQFPDHRSGLLALFGNDIPRDARRLVGFARDISVVPADYAYDPPAYVAKFPQDLFNRNLFYSGLYEDGYASETARLQLRAGDGDRLRIAGFVPYRGNPNIRTHLTITIDGRVAGAFDLALGDFDVKLPGTFSSANYTVQLDFDRTQRLPPPDTRIIGATMNFIGFAH